MEYEAEYLKNLIFEFASKSCIGCISKLYSNFPNHHTCVNSLDLKLYYYFDIAFTVFEQNIPNHHLTKETAYDYINDSKECSV